MDNKEYIATTLKKKDYNAILNLILDNQQRKDKIIYNMVYEYAKNIKDVLLVKYLADVGKISILMKPTFRMNGTEYIFNIRRPKISEISLLTI